MNYAAPCFPSFTNSQLSIKISALSSSIIRSHSASSDLCRKMKREGFQHGMVRTFRILPSTLSPRPLTRFINEQDSPPTAGFFTRVSPKPTNHSKFTGKCGKPRCSGCHSRPACKAKGKTKGAHKLDSFNVVKNYRLLAWRVVDARPGLEFLRLSATAISDHLLNGFGDTDDYSDEAGDWVEEAGDNGESRDNHNNYERGGDDYGDDDDDKLSFCKMILDLDKVTEEDDDWCLVGEMRIC